MGISEMWPLSLLLLHTKLRKTFPSFIPLLEEFTLGDENTNNVTRSNTNNSSYKIFKTTVVGKYSADLHKQNELGTQYFNFITTTTLSLLKTYYYIKKHLKSFVMICMNMNYGNTKL